MTEIILGPPGTGKTKTLLDAVEGELDRGVAPDRLGFVTFTKRAAEEATTRACQRFGLTRKQMPYFRTLHSLCFRQLGLSGGEVLDGGRVKKDFAEYSGLEITGRWTDEGTFLGYAEGDRLLFMENLARIRGIPLRQQYELNDDGLAWRRVEHTAEALAKFKSENGVLDYTDMLSEFVDRGQVPELETLFVDEAQDQSRLQWDVVNCLSASARRTVVAGDDDQAIYRWAGADVDQLVNLPGDTKVLGQSYRCPQAIQKVANSLLGMIRGSRRVKTWRARDSQGVVQKLASLGDTDLSGDWEGEVQPVLVLARNEYILREQVEPELRSRGIIYEHASRISIKLPLLEAVEVWEELRAGKAVPITAALRVYALMNRGVERAHRDLPRFPRDEDTTVTMADLRRDGGLLTDAIWHDALDKMPTEETSYLLAARRHGERLRARPRVRVSTIHGAKGGEARHVVIMTEMAARTYDEMEHFPDDELRVWYVAVTRARERLTMIAAADPWARQVPWL